MATASSSTFVRLEDVFQDETVKKFADITEFKKFARSRFGLCLDQSDIQNIDENNDGSEDKKIAMLELWRQKNGAGATISKIQYLVERYLIGDNPEIRLEDVFQDEIFKAFASITELKKFARSKNGLCLNESDIQNIDEDTDNSEDKKMAMLEMWRQKNGADATIPRIRYLVERYPKGDNPENYTRLSEMFGLFKDKRLCKGKEVYLGEQISSIIGPIPRAIKMLPYDEKGLKEAGLLTKLGHHENVVSVIHVDKFHGGFTDYIYIVMELFSSKHLRDLLEEFNQSNTVIDDDNVIGLAAQILKAVVFIHEKKVIHRDLKPENILISKDNKKVKVTDFGISKIINEGDYTKQTNTVTGTEGYMASETYKNNLISQKSDQFSLGIILAELFSRGRHPFGKDPHSRKHYIINHKIIDLDHIDQAMVKNLIKQLLYKDPETRPSAIEAFNSFMDFVQSQNTTFNEKVSDDSSSTAKETQSRQSVPELKENFQVLAIQKKTPSTSNETKTGVRNSDSKNRVEQKGARSKISSRTGNKGQISQSNETQAAALSAQPVYSIETMTEVQKSDSVDRVMKKEAHSKTTSVTANAIIIFNVNDWNMYSFKPSLKEWNKMQAFSDPGMPVVLDQYIYSICRRKVFRLKYSDAAANWNRVADMKEDHGRYPPSVAFKGSIYACGNGFTPSRTVERYDVSENAWNFSPQMIIEREAPCLVASEDHIYAIGGQDEKEDDLESAERFDGKKWEMIEEAPRGIPLASAVVLDKKIYVSDKEGVQCYNIETSLRKVLNLSSTWPFTLSYLTKILNVDNKLYIIGLTNGTGYAIYLLDPRTEQMTLIETVVDKSFYQNQCVAVKL